MRAQCTAEGCGQQQHAKKYCKKHYELARKSGEIVAAKKKSLPERFWEKVEKTDTCWNWTGQRNELGYGLMWLNGKGGYRAHRMAYELSIGPIPEGMVIDHRCHNASCVNPAHLRACTQKQNSEHKIGASKGNPSGRRGVHWRKDTNKWTGSVMHNMKLYHIGSYTDIDEAEAAVLALRLRHFTHTDIDRQQDAA
jgi:hypothetical protein